MATATSTSHLASKAEPVFALEKVIPISRNGQRVKFSTTITVGLVGELLESEKIWVDYDYQRRVKVSYRKDGSEQRTPMVDQNRVADMTEKILQGQLYGGALCWNLRLKEVDFTYDEAQLCLQILSGRPTIPDSNHRHQAILKVYKLVRERGYSFDVNAYEFPLLIELLDLEGERGLFYEYNQLGKPANPTRSKWLNQADLHNRLTSMVIDMCQLKGHVELVTNNISKNSTKVVTFNTLSTSIAKAFPQLDEENLLDISCYLVDFFDYLISVRPEVGYLPVARRQQVRAEGIGDSGLAFLGYISLAGDLMGYEDWQSYVDRLGQSYRYQENPSESVWEGDLMSRDNPLWRGTVLATGRSGSLTVINQKSSRTFIHEALREVLGLQDRP